MGQLQMTDLEVLDNHGLGMNKTHLHWNQKTWGFDQNKCFIVLE
jgi:hypothetical protein